ncbi:Ppx/GppA family phosphatase [Streptomyces sp. 549]|uniref:Ppx/GppA phosphatase family protein n=1 Tax=Streptomyces sp. 549 TaxID=3049076 RepID=UPI0024C44331|nr:Ppx/GppA family phosphatase [Streptomyces sp. 549]MDK1471939.1 Ppx/GppA family phosphatase [Streptomyces sp. 549]
MGSQSASLLVADSVKGVLEPVDSARRRLRLAQLAGRDGRLGKAAADRIADAVAECRDRAREAGAEELMVYATAVVREAPDRAELQRTVKERTGVRLPVLPPGRKAEMAFLAARRWAGRRAGPLTLLDIGGSRLEVAAGDGRPDFAMSLPLGAGRLTREWFAGQDPPEPEVLERLRLHVQGELADAVRRIHDSGPSTTVVTSRTFQQLARLCGAAPRRAGPRVPRVLGVDDLGRAVEQLAALPAPERAKLPGISTARSGQALAGAVVAHEAMRQLGLESVRVCPWAVREGVILHRVETADRPGPAGPWQRLEPMGGC